MFRTNIRSCSFHRIPLQFVDGDSLMGGRMHITFLLTEPDPASEDSSKMFSRTITFSVPSIINDNISVISVAFTNTGANITLTSSVEYSTPICRNAARFKAIEQLTDLMFWALVGEKEVVDSRREHLYDSIAKFLDHALDF